MNTTAISARGLEKRFGRSTALRDIDMEVPSGSCLAVLGPNGAGKSTLLRLVAGLARPTTGTLRVDGLAPTSRRARARIGYVGHATLLYPMLTAFENLLFAARLYGVAEPAARARHLLEEEGLAAVAARSVGELSRGMAQRVSIARSLVHDPSVVLLDEPFTGLDAGSADRLARRVRSLRDAGRTLLLVSHDLGRAAEIADTALVLAGGRVELTTAGPPDARQLAAKIAEVGT
ncbi:MAG: ABC transporter ATP-binding protein [Myxococcota bacterium]